MRILVLEKSGSDMSLIESYLSAFGMQCEITSSEASALSMLTGSNGGSAEPFDLLILDYETPAGGGFRFVESIRNHSKIRNMPKLMMLLPMMREDLFDRLSEHGVDIAIGKPIIPSNLLNGILDVLGLREVPESQPAAAREACPTKLEQTHVALLVEDNKTNQLIAKTLLEQAGIEPILADNGHEAVELYRQHKDRIDLILMDLHMPVMNGLEAAEEIRTISDCVPIVAMTADVILGVQERCAQSGIYHYISKPFDPDRFIETVKEIIEESENNGARGERVLDRSVGLRNLGGDSEAYRQVLDEFLHENQNTVDKLARAIREERYAEAEQVVHKVKSSLGSIGAQVLYDTAVALQRALSEANKEDILRIKDEFSALFARLLEEITESQH